MIEFTSFEKSSAGSEDAFTVFVRPNLWNLRKHKEVSQTSKLCSLSRMCLCLYDFAHKKTTKTVLLLSGGSRGGGRRARAPPPPGDRIFFNFMQFSGNFNKIVFWRPPWKLAPLLGEILDPPLLLTIFLLLRYIFCFTVLWWSTLCLNINNSRFWFPGVTFHVTYKIYLFCSSDSAQVYKVDLIWSYQLQRMRSHII